MKLIKQIGPRCMIYATAMLFDCDPKEVSDFVGHDGVGEDVIGIHIQEVQKFAMSKGYVLALFEPAPVLNDSVIHVWDDNEFFKFEGLMLGQTSKGANHCVAWDGEKIFDPRSIEDFAALRQFWAKVKLDLKSF